MSDFRQRTDGESVQQWMDRRVGQVLSGAGVDFHCTATLGKDSAQTRIVFEVSDKRPKGDVKLTDGELHVSLGKEPEKMFPEDVMSFFGKVALKAQGLGCKKVAFRLPDKGIDAKFAAMGVQTALLRADELQTKVTDLGIEDVTFFTEEGQFAAINRGLELARAANTSRFLTAMPPNLLTVDTFFNLAHAHFSDLEAEFLGVDGQPDSVEYDKMGMLGAVAAGNGGNRRVLAIRLDPLSGPTEKVVAYVGKTLVFDAGGLNIKGTHARGMKGDMGGGASLFGSATYLAMNRQLLKRSVVFVWTITENVIGPEAYRPDDVLTAFNGTTVEVDNTDAEGRLALGDAMAWICTIVKVEQLVPVCTLTGAAVVALGSSATAMHLKDSRTRLSEVRQLEDLSFRCGDSMNILHHYPEAAAALASNIADVKNAGGSNRGAGSSQGFAFLLNFAPEGVDVMELDIAGKSGNFSNGSGVQTGTSLPAAVWFTIGRESSYEAPVK